MLARIKQVFSLGALCAFSALSTADVQAQCTSWDAYPDGVDQAKEQHVLYRDMFKAKNYTEAYPLWSKLFETVKSPKDAPTRHFQDGIIFCVEFMKKETDPTKKAEHMKTLISLYDQMAECSGDNALNRAYQGYYMYAHQHANTLETAAVFEKCLELGKAKPPAFALDSYTRLILFLYQNKVAKYNDEYLRNFYDKVKGIAEADAATYGSTWTSIQALYKPIGGTLWGCDYYVKEWSPKFEADQQNMEQNKEILKIIKSKCGKDNEFYAKVDAVYAPWKRTQDSIALVEKFDGFCSYKKAQFRMMQANGAKKNGNEEEYKRLRGEAMGWYEKSLDETPSDEECVLSTEDKANLVMTVADYQFRKGSFSKARSLCRKASKIRSNWGDPYILVGLMYASSGKRCGPGTGWDSQVVVWAAMDEWSKAKSVDPSAAARANKYIRQYKEFLPTKGDVFQKSLKVGQSYKIGCWINATTTIRAK